jgi:hypothetical protein
VIRWLKRLFYRIELWDLLRVTDDDSRWACEQRWARIHDLRGRLSQ